MQGFKNWWAVDTFKKQQLSHRHLLQAIDLFDMTKGFSIFHSVLPDNVDTVFFNILPHNRYHYMEKVTTSMSSDPTIAPFSSKMFKVLITP